MKFDKLLKKYGIPASMTAKIAGLIAFLYKHPTFMNLALKQIGESQDLTEGSSMKKSKGHIAFVNDFEYLIGKDDEIYRAKLTDAFDTRSKNRIGRWECSLSHGLQYAKVMGLDKKQIKQAMKRLRLKESATMKIKKSDLTAVVREVLEESVLEEGRYDFDNDVEALIRKYKFDRKSRREFLAAVKKAAEMIHIW